MFNITIGDSRIIEKKFRGTRRQYVSIKMIDGTYYKSEINMTVVTAFFLEKLVNQLETTPRHEPHNTQGRR